jgi:isocitrate lyase
MSVAENSNVNGDELQAVEDDWIKKAGLKLFDEAVIDTIKSGNSPRKQSLIRNYTVRVKGKSNDFARKVAKNLLNVDVYFNWEAPRTREGYYRYKGGCQCAITRAVAYAPYTDCIWMESKLPDFSQAKEFADGVHRVWPQQK